MDERPYTGAEAPSKRVRDVASREGDTYLALRERNESELRYLTKASPQGTLRAVLRTRPGRDGLRWALGTTQDLIREMPDADRRLVFLEALSQRDPDELVEELAMWIWPQVKIQAPSVLLEIFRNCSEDLCGTLLEIDTHGVDKHTFGGSSLFTTAVDRGFYRLAVELFKNTKTNINEVDGMGQGSLSHVMASKTLQESEVEDLAKNLMNAGVMTDTDTALAIGARFRPVRVMRTLLDTSQSRGQALRSVLMSTNLDSMEFIRQIVMRDEHQVDTALLKMRAGETFVSPMDGSDLSAALDKMNEDEQKETLMMHLSSMNAPDGELGRVGMAVFLRTEPHPATIAAVIKYMTPDAVTADGRTSLMMAMPNCSVQGIDIVVKAAEEAETLEVVDDDGNNALHHMVMSRLLGRDGLVIMRMMPQLRAMQNLADQTPYEMATKMPPGKRPPTSVLINLQPTRPMTIVRLKSLKADVTRVRKTKNESTGQGQAPRARPKKKL